MKIGIVYPGDREARRTATPENGRFLNLFKAFEALGVRAEPVVYHDEFCGEVQEQLMKMNAALVWVNPIEGGRDRLKLDSLLRDLSKNGVFVSTHPDLIGKLGTKQVLVKTREVGWGSDTHLYSSLAQMRQELCARLAKGEIRVLKQYRGHSGDGVWKIERAEADGDMHGQSKVRIRHAKTGSVEECVTFDEFCERCVPYFSALNGRGCMVDQAYQPRLLEGMVRCYLVGGRIEGFGRQEIVALHPTEPRPLPRHYHPPTMPEFQRLKQLVEQDWVPAVQRLLQIETAELPMLWDCDFLFGAKDAEGRDTYVLCEINVSCVTPFPESAVEPLAKAVVERITSGAALRPPATSI